MLSLLLFDSNPNSNQRVQGLQIVLEKPLSLGLEPMTKLYRGPTRQVSADLSNLLIGIARKSSRRFESQTEKFFPENSGAPGHSDLSMGLS